MSRSPDTPLVDNLGIQPSLRANLQSAGILTIAQLEEELQDEKALMQKVVDCGPKSITELRNAIGAFRRRGVSHAASEARHNNRLARGITWMLVTTLALLLLEFFVWGSVSLPGWIIVNGLIALAAAVIIFNLFPSTEASVTGTASGSLPNGTWSLPVKIGGALAAWVIVFSFLTAPIWLFSARTIQVYLVPSRASGETGAVKARSIEIEYRRAVNQGLTRGLGNSVTIHDLPSWMDELTVSDFNCPGWILDKQHAGEGPPWRYAITANEVTIEVVRRKSVEDPMPEAKDVRALISQSGFDDKRIRTGGKYPRHQVWLTVENKADRPIDLVLYDCIAALDEGKATFIAKGGIQRGDRRNIQPDERVPFDSFKDYDNALGWFAIFVRFDDDRGDKRQRFLGCRNLFNTKSPRLVVERGEGSGEDFVISKTLSRLED